MNKKNKLFGLLAVIGCAALTAGFGLQVTANAEENFGMPEGGFGEFGSSFSADKSESSGPATGTPAK